MKIKALATCLSALATPLLAAPATGQPVTAPAGDWGSRIRQTDVGSFVAGNPDARTRVTEYASYTCSHCADFETKAHGPLFVTYLPTGNVSFELRNFVRDPVDLTIAMLARCDGKEKFFENHNAFMSLQPAWMAELRKTTPAQRDAWRNGTMPERMEQITRDLGLYSVMESQGLSESQVNACLSDTDAQHKILAMTKYARETLKIPGTPGFAINNRVIEDVYNWETLETELRRR